MQDINTVNWNAIYRECNNDLHEITAKTIDLLNSIANKHALIRHTSQGKQKLFNKPYITNSIFKSIKTKHNMYKTHFLSNNPSKMGEYKKYANVKLAYKYKQKNYSQHFGLCKNDLKEAWKLIGILVKRNSKGLTPIAKIVRNNRVYFLHDIRGLPHRWFESYLKHRTQYVKIESVKSGYENNTCGIPQGSTLGPLLFLLSM